MQSFAVSSPCPRNIRKIPMHLEPCQYACILHESQMTTGTDGDICGNARITSSVNGQILCWRNRLAAENTYVRNTDKALRKV
jgi:hypothetical protein